MDYGLTKRETDLLMSLFKRTPEVEMVYIFGSRVKNTFKKTSDIDFGVIFCEGAEDKTSYLMSEFDDLSIIQEVDIANEALMSEGTFKDEYERTKKVFYRKEDKLK